MQQTLFAPGADSDATRARNAAWQGSVPFFMALSFAVVVEQYSEGGADGLSLETGERSVRDGLS